jgi:hypothetical protein
LSQHKEQQGFVTIAINSEDTDYLQLAYLQAMNIKSTQLNNKYAVIVDDNTFQLVTEQHRAVFDYVIPMTTTNDNAFANEPQVFTLTPFKETIKLEADLLFTRSIDHWWTAFRLRDICMPSGARTFMNDVSACHKYRELFASNNLPNTYNGLMYFRYTRTAANFFVTASKVFEHWSVIQENLKQIDGPPTTDVVYAIAALILGEESCTMPRMDFLNFVHMKSGFNGWSDSQGWLDTVIHELDGDMIRINNINQLSPVHYHDKKYATKELIEYYEQRVLAGG